MSQKIVDTPLRDSFLERIKKPGCPSVKTIAEERGLPKATLYSWIAAERQRNRQGIRNKYMTYEFDLHESKEEGRAEGKTEGKLEMVDAMFANPKWTDEDIASISGFPLDEIQKRRAQR